MNGSATLGLLVIDAGNLAIQTRRAGMAYRRWKLLLIAGAAVPLLVWGFDRCQYMYWVGSTDLEVEFVVSDAQTGVPVPDAKIELQSAEVPDFELVTDANGVVIKECPGTMCSGKTSGLAFTNSFSVHVPGWIYRVVADGFASTEWTALRELGLGRQVQRLAPGKTKLVVPVSLHKKQS